MPRILVNCHGGRVVGPPAHPVTFRVPSGVFIHFYTRDGCILSNLDAWSIYNHRLRLEYRDPVGTITIEPGKVCQDYYGVPYPSLRAANGIQLEVLGRGGMPYFDTILSAGSGQNWGAPRFGTIITRRVVLPAVRVGAMPYARSVVRLSDIANCPGITHVDWISCRERW